MNMFKVGDVVRDPHTRDLHRVVEVNGNYLKVVSLCARPRYYMSSVYYGWLLVQ